MPSKISKPSIGEALRKGTQAKPHGVECRGGLLERSKSLFSAAREIHRAVSEAHGQEEVGQMALDYIIEQFWATGGPGQRMTSPPTPTEIKRPFPQAKQKKIWQH